MQTKRVAACLALVAALGLGCTVHVHVTIPAFGPAAPISAPVVPVAPAPAPHMGHFTVSYIEPKYPSPTSAAVRDGLAKVKATGIDTTYRSYVEGQEQLTTLGFTAYFKSADLPIVFLQEDQAAGSPIIGSLKSPPSAEAVVAWVRGFRGR